MKGPKNVKEDFYLVMALAFLIEMTGCTWFLSEILHFLREKFFMFEIFEMPHFPHFRIKFSIISRIQKARFG